MRGYLRLPTGETYAGEWIGGADGVLGEVVFFTGMTGYQEVISDPSFNGQIVVFTYPLIGNYGINAFDFESTRPQVSGVVLSQTDGRGDHWQSQATFAAELAKWEIPVLAGVDTRSVVQKIRTAGDMPAVLTHDENPSSIDYDVVYRENRVRKVASASVKTISTGHPHVVLVDFGYKKSIAETLCDLGCKVTIVPFNTDIDTINALKPDGILLSNGPGNPKQLTPYLPKIKELALNWPTLGICLGHQLLALAFGGDTEKLTFGHRGANQPVQDLKTGCVGMTAQNHSYVVKAESLENTAFEVQYLNINDGSVEGMAHKQEKIWSVQFHPEGHPGPADFQSIFTDYVRAIKGGKVYANA